MLTWTKPIYFKIMDIWHTWIKNFGGTKLPHS